MADRAIAELNGKRLPGHGRRPGRSTLSSGELHTYFDTLQVRFADTDTQKLIKKTESEQEKRLALEASGQIPPRSRKGQAYRRLSFSTEQKIRNSSRRGRRGSAVPGDGSLYGPPTSLNPPPFSPALPAPSRGFPSFDVTFGPTSAFRPTTPGLSHTPSLPYAPPNSPVLNSLTSRSYSNDTPPSLGGFTSSSYGSSPGSFSSFSPNPAYMSSYARSNTPLCVRGPSFPPAPHPGIGLGLSFESGSNVSDLHGLGFQGYGNQSYQSMNNTVTGRRGSDALSINSSLEGMTSLFGRSSLHSSSSQLGDSQATYDLAKLGVAPPATPPPEGSHAFFDNTPLDARSGSSHRRPLSRNHQRAHTTALDAFPATPGSYDPDYSPSKLLAPASALARRSSAVEAHIARRKA